MTAPPKFGDAIPTNGVRLPWLPERTDFIAEWKTEGLSDDVFQASDLDDAWDLITAIRLEVPRYDFVYLALERGMVPYFGQGKPSDWNGRVVLFRGDVVFATGAVLHDDFMWQHDNESDDIIGYTRKATSPALPLAHPASPQGEEDRLREALKRIAYLRPAGDVERCVGAKKLVAQMERIALAALAPAAIASGREGAE